MTGDCVARWGPGSWGLLGNWWMFWQSGPLAHREGHFSNPFIIGLDENLELIRTLLFVTTKVKT